MRALRDLSDDLVLINASLTQTDVKHAKQILIGTVLTTNTPPNELTGMTSKSRQLAESLDTLIANRREYTDRHNYALDVSLISEDSTRPTSWGRLRYLRRVLYHYEWVFYMDADVLITNMSAPLESFMDPAYDIIVCWDVGNTNIQAGNILARNTSWTRAYLDEVYSYTEFTTHVWVEQQAMIEYTNRHSDWKTHIKVLPQRAFNSFPAERFANHDSTYWRPGDFVVHFAGVTEISSELQRYLPRVVR